MKIIKISMMKNRNKKYKIKMKNQIIEWKLF